jgi:hypothetical protein
LPLSRRLSPKKKHIYKECLDPLKEKILKKSLINHTYEKGALLSNYMGYLVDISLYREILLHDKK